MNNIFPLKIKEEGLYLGMGEYGSRYILTTSDGRIICRSDYEPKGIDNINSTVKEFMSK